MIAVNDAYRLLPYADILYACDLKWWRLHLDDVRRMFHGEPWTSHDQEQGGSNNKAELADSGVRIVAGGHGQRFSTDPRRIHYGSNSGYQAINLALLKGATRVILVGFDMRGRGHFFGDHPEPLHNRDSYAAFLPEFRAAAQACQVPILNATPGSGLDCWPIVPLEEALGDDLLHRDRPEPDRCAGAVGA